MTETVSGPGRAQTRPRRPRRPGPYPVAAGSLAGFLGLFGFLAYQLRTGQDPALGGQIAAAPAPAKHVVLKRIERRVIVTRLLPPKPAQVRVVAGAPAAATSAPSPAPQRVVVQRAPAVAPAPAPPAPAPVVTRSS
jgi:hypothetical protein